MIVHGYRVNPVLRWFFHKFDDLPGHARQRLQHHLLLVLRLHQHVRGALDEEGEQDLLVRFETDGGVMRHQLPLHLLQQHVHAPVEQREDQLLVRHERRVQPAHKALRVGVQLADALKAVHDRRDGLVLHLLRERVHVLVMLVESGLVDQRQLAQPLDPDPFQRVLRAQLHIRGADALAGLYHAQVHVPPHTQLFRGLVAYPTTVPDC